MEQVPVLLAFLLTISYNVDAQTSTPCSFQRNGACLSAMRSLFTNTSAYWFGTRFATDCPPGSGGLLCTNLNPSGTSLLTRLLGNNAADASGLSFVVNVTYGITLPADGSDRTYPGCGRIVDVPLTRSQYFSIDALSSTVYPPFDLRELPEVTWPAEQNALYTVMMYDVGFSFMHALYINVAGGRLQGGDTIVDYFGPGNPLERVNPYMWVVFRQQGPLDVFTISSFFRTLQSQSQNVFVRDFVLPLRLSMQSYGINVVMVTTDEYAAARIRSINFLNRCPVYYGQWMNRYIQGRGGLPSLPVRFDLSVSIDVSFTAPAITYTSCDVVYQRSPVNLTVDYRNVELLGAVEARLTPQVSLVPIEILNQPPSVTLRDRMYTLMMYDPTPEIGQTDQNSYVHWMIVNIRGTDITSGDVVYDWLLPMTPRLNQLYLFVLLEQTAPVSPTTAISFGATDCHPYIIRRCKFRAGDFIRYNNLSLVGMRHLRVIPDTYQQYMSYMVTNFRTKAQSCWGEAPDPPQCPVRSGGTQAKAAGVMSVLAVMASYLTFRN
ncbi:uncharacterized protein [Haliotis asinina]|uniref:uncharacterized protein n=1 Tax=Haliotis asinina TaxID=109174 RepID=UPI0035324066